MKKETIYTYLGKNGILCTPVFIEGAVASKSIRLMAENGYILTDGTVRRKMIEVSEDEVDSWTEIPEDGQK